MREGEGDVCARDLLDAPTALEACCGFDLCHKYILYLYLSARPPNQGFAFSCTSGQSGTRWRGTHDQV